MKTTNKNLLTCLKEDNFSIINGNSWANKQIRKWNTSLSDSEIKWKLIKTKVINQTARSKKMNQYPSLTRNSKNTIIHNKQSLNWDSIEYTRPMLQKDTRLLIIQHCGSQPDIKTCITRRNTVLQMKWFRETRKGATKQQNVRFGRPIVWNPVEMRLNLRLSVVSDLSCSDSPLPNDDSSRSLPITRLGGRDRIFLSGVFKHRSNKISNKKRN